MIQNIIAGQKAELKPEVENFRTRWFDYMQKKPS